MPKALERLRWKSAFNHLKQDKNKQQQHHYFYYYYYNDNEKIKMTEEKRRKKNGRDETNSMRLTGWLEFWLLRTQIRKNRE